MLEMTKFEWPKELRQELSYLIDTNPRDPEVFRRGPEEARKYVYVVVIAIFGHI